MAEYKTTVTETEDGGRTITSGNMTEQEAAKLAAERERTKNMNTSDSASAASDALDKDIAAKKRYTEMQNILALGGHKSMSDEEKEAFVEEYKKLKSDYSFAEGGAVPMNNMAKQMEMFEEGGLMDEGGTVDPVSGNDVPPGSNQEEVRDDIPAQLSEGEFVFPADVVRFIGLEKLMMIRQRAKAGLQRMEDMGQMGNSEEAVMPDDLPFSIDDLDMEDDGLEMAQGGVVQAANGTFVQPTPTTPNAGVYYNPAGSSTTGVAAAPMKAASASVGQAATPVQAGSGKTTMFTDYELPQAPVPVMTAPDQLPKFLGEVAPGVGGVDYTEEVYVNEAGNIIKFRRYNDGSLKDSSGNEAVIPEGYKIKSEAEEKVTVDPTKVKTATVQDDGDNDTFEEDQAKMKQDQARVDAAKALGYKDFVGFKDGLAAALGFTTLPAGTVTGIGYIADGLGNIVDPTTGLVVPQGLLASIKNTASIIGDTITGVGDKGLLGSDGKINPNVYDKNLSTRNIIAKGFGVKDPKTGKVNLEVQKIRTEMAKVKVKEKFNNIRQDIKDGKYTGDFANSEGFEDYVDTVEKSISNEIDRGNVDFQTGQTINPFEASSGRNRGDGRFDDEPSSAPAPSASARDGGNPGGTSISSGRDASTGAGMNEGQGDNNNNDGPAEGGGGYSSGMGVICLTEDMKVRRNGVIDFVTNIKVGDLVDNTTVTEVLHKHMREGYYKVNGELKITNDHPVLANGSWKRTEDLVLGDYINNVEVTSLEYVEQVTPTVYIGTTDDRYDVYTEGEVYTVHGQYKNALKKAA